MNTNEHAVGCRYGWDVAELMYGSAYRSAYPKDSKRKASTLEESEPEIKVVIKIQEEIFNTD